MFSNKKKWFALVALVIVASLLLAACQCGGEEVPDETPEPGDEPTGEIVDYKVGMYEDPVSLNYWNYLGPGSSVWTQYVVNGHAGALFTLSDVTYQWVPSLAKDLPAEPAEEGGKWVVTVDMVEDAKWSDGESIDAEDVVFTHNTCKDLKLTQNWPNQCAPMGADVTAEATGDYTVKYTFAEEPGLGVWQMGVGLAPILPKHYWEEKVGEALAFIDGVTEPDEECDPDEPSAACQAYTEAFENARKTLYEADPTGQPSAGGYVTGQWESGAFVQRGANAEYYFKDSEIVEWEDGTWMLSLADGTELKLYGDGTGDETLRYTGGPYAANVVMSIYGSQDAAFLALENGEIDFVFSPTGIPRGLRDRAIATQGINSYTNADYGMYYLAFNTRKYPMSEYEFRQAFDIIIDKEFVVNSVLQGSVFPMYSAMPPGNPYWFNDAVEFPYKDLSRAERVDEAVKVLKAAGWKWDKDPEWSDDIEDVVPGEGITMPNGEAMPELVILGPGPAYDPLRATYNQWISEWARELGMPVKSELTGFNTILGPVFIEANFDMYILGWSLGNPAFPDYFEAFFHSRNDTAVSGNYNTPGFNNAEYDEVVDKFMTSQDIEEARGYVFTMQEILADERPYICLFYKQVHDVARDNLEFPYTEVLSGITNLAGMQTDTKPLAK